MRVSTPASFAGLAVGVALTLTSSGFGQPTAAPPAFEAADVHPSTNNSQNGQFVRGPFTSGGRYQLRSATMVDLIAKAYGVDTDKVIGGPNWLEYDRFDVFAKMPPGANAESAKLMLQALLADRFKLVAKNDVRQMQAYALTAGKGKPKLKETEGSGDGCKISIQGLPAAGPDGGPAGNASPMLAVACRNMTMAAFAENLRTLPNASQFLGTSPVIDKTDLMGSWDFDFKLSLAGLIVLNGAPAQSDNATLPEVLDKQLGLKLDPVKVPLSVVVVESANRNPTPNAPDIATKLPIPATEFDVAEVRPITPGGPNGARLGWQVQPGGRINLSLPMKLLIQQAWGVNNDMIVGAPKWMDSDFFEIIAKAPPDSVPTGPATGAGQGPVDIDSVWVMMRALLIDRFKMSIHMEDRPGTAYNLVAVKPKLKKADPASRTKWTNAPPDPKNAGPAAARTYTIQNMTMAQLGEKLQFIAPDYIHSPVLDKTGLDGGYDFTLTFNLNFAINGRGGPIFIGPEAPGGTAGGGPNAADPSGGTTLFQAVEKQLGLKLEETKRPVPFLVIEHAEEKPTEN